MAFKSNGPLICIRRVLNPGNKQAAYSQHKRWIINKHSKRNLNFNKIIPVFKTTSYQFIIIIVIAVMFTACGKDYLSSTPIPDQSFVEEFDTLSAALAKGWQMVNASDPIGNGVWTQGMTGNQSDPPYKAYSPIGDPNKFVSCDFTSAESPAPAQSTISNFLISPAIALQNGDKIIFYTRESDMYSKWGDRLQVCLNTTDDTYADCGKGTDPGKFSTVLLDINKTSAVGYNPDEPVPLPPYPFDPNQGFPSQPISNALAYPRQWTRFEAAVTGLAMPVKGRFAFRYYVEGGGTNGLGEHISIDSVAYVSVNHQ